MAGISTGGGGGKKSVDQDIPLVPFIDLLLCCVMFLLVTAVWNQLARLNASQEREGPAPTTAIEEQPPEPLRLVLQVHGSGYVLASSAGESIAIPKTGAGYDVGGLRTRLASVHQLDPNRHDITIAPEDGVRYEDVVNAMDAVVGADYPNVTISPTSALQ